jgi:hypothetical protein
VTRSSLLCRKTFSFPEHHDSSKAPWIDGEIQHPAYLAGLDDLDRIELVTISGCRVASDAKPVGDLILAGSLTVPTASKGNHRALPRPDSIQPILHPRPQKFVR